MSPRLKVSKQDLIEKVTEARDKLQAEFDEAQAKYEKEYREYPNRLADALERLVRDLRSGKVVIEFNERRGYDTLVKKRTGVPVLECYRLENFVALPERPSHTFNGYIQALNGTLEWLSSVSQDTVTLNREQYHNLLRGRR